MIAARGPIRLQATALALAATLAALVSIPAVATAATTRYVSPSGSGVAACTPAAPCSLTHAFTLSTAGDTVVIAGNQGTYGTPVSPLPEHFVVKVGVAVEGAAGQPRPAIYASGTPPALRLEVEATLKRLDLHYAPAGSGEALFAAGENSVEGVTAQATGTTTAGCITGVEVTITDSICAGDTWGIFDAVGGPGSWPLILRNDTIYGGQEGLRLASSGPALTVTAVNTIVRGPEKDIRAGDGGGHVTVSLSHSNFATVSAEGGASVTAAGSGTNQTASPLFANAGGGDFHQLAGSPTIDAGVNEAANGAFDLDGNPRALPARLSCSESIPAITDIGAFEFVPAVPACPPPPPAPITTAARPGTKLGKAKIEGTKATFRFSGSGTGVTGFECRLDKGKWKRCRSPHTYKHLSSGKHRFRVRALSAAGADPTPALRRFHIK